MGLFWLVLFVTFPRVTSHIANDVIAFYHIGVDSLNGSHVEIIDEQIGLMNFTGLLKRVKQVRYGLVYKQDFHDPGHLRHPDYAALGYASLKRNFSLDAGRYGDKFVYIGDYSGGKIYETKTLSKLYNHCKGHSDDKVLYFHTKGVFHKRGSNNHLRKILNTFTLSTACIDALENYDTCGMRLSPAPYIHYSGNFWWATCRYVNTLIDPDKWHVGDPQLTNLQGKMLQHYKTQPHYRAKNAKTRVRNNQGLHRYFSEAWLGSAPYINGADCVPADIAPNYLYGYSGTQQILEYVQRIRDTKDFASINCTTAATNTSTKVFRKAFHTHLRLEPFMEVGSVSFKTNLLYKDDPHSLIDWRKRLGEDMHM